MCERASDAMQTTIRRYRESDAETAGCLIAETFRRFNLSYASAGEQERLLGPFRHAGSSDPAHRREIAALLQAPIVLAATVRETGRIVGILRGRPGRLHSLFVHEEFHRRGIGRAMMAVFEATCLASGVDRITMQSSLYAVPFYQALGYKRSTGVRSGPCFDGADFPYQPMKKLLWHGHPGGGASSSLRFPPHDAHTGRRPHVPS